MAADNVALNSSLKIPPVKCMLCTHRANKL